MKKNNVALIPVRGGSKSIPLKNIKPINGRPLVYWTIDAAVACKYIDKVYVSTDSELIRDCVEQYCGLYNCANKLECVERDPETATDVASTESAIADFANRYEFDNIVLIQATSPLLSSSDLTSAIEKYNAEEYDSLLSVVRQKRFVWRKENAGYLPLNYDYLNRPRRQEFDGYFVENGAFYITSRQCFEKSKCRISGNIGIYEMSEETYFEIDEMSDWIIVENLLKSKQMYIPALKSEIKLFVTDCDGCMTDGGMYYSENGDEMKKFNTLDGMGIELLRNAGIKTGIITGEKTMIVKRRSEKLNLDYLYQGIKDKFSVLKDIVTSEEISMDEVAYVGDDINDLECIRNCGLGMAMPNSPTDVRDVADIILTKKGGEGAIREAAEIILSRG